MNDAVLIWHARKVSAEVADKFPEYAEVAKAIQFRIWSMSACAGKAWPHKKLIKLSRSYFQDQSNFDNKFRNTVLHEIAHILTPGDHHGNKWYEVARKIGCSGERCHTLQLAEGYTKRRKRFSVISCDCGDFKFDARKYPAYALRNINKHACQKCNIAYNYKGEVLA